MIAFTMITMALRHLVLLGGKDVVVETLNGIVAGVGRGDYPELPHVAGNA